LEVGRPCTPTTRLPQSRPGNETLKPASSSHRCSWQNCATLYAVAITNSLQRRDRKQCLPRHDQQEQCQCLSVEAAPPPPPSPPLLHSGRRHAAKLHGAGPSPRPTIAAPGLAAEIGAAASATSAAIMRQLPCQRPALQPQACTAATDPALAPPRGRSQMRLAQAVAMSWCVRLISMWHR